MKTRLSYHLLTIALLLSGCGSAAESSSGTGAGSPTGPGAGGAGTGAGDAAGGGQGGSSGAATTGSGGVAGNGGATSSGTAGAGAGGSGTAGAGAGGSGTGASGGAGGSGASGGSGGSTGAGTAELCPVPSMLDLFGGFFPPNPYDPSLPVPADACLSQPHDVIIVLGCPNNANGTPAACQTTRADIAVALKDAGYASKFITTGAAVQNMYVEAETLEQLLIDRGVPAADIFTEPLAKHTDENIYYSTKIMEANAWESAIIVSEDPGHLVMTAVCDSNCCVDLGRFTVVSLPAAGGPFTAAHYARYPWGTQVTTAECDLIKQPFKAMCINLPTRLACKDNFQL
jgi:hypothetical protein